MVNGVTLNTTKVNFTAKNQVTTSLPVVNNLKQDTVSFSGKNKEINKRIEGFAKLMGDKPIPQEVMDILKSDIPITFPKEKNAVERLWDKLSDALKIDSVEKVRPKVLSDVDVVSIRLNKMKILKKKEGLLGGKAEVYFISLVNDGINEPASLKVETFNGLKKNDDLCDHGLQKPYTVYISEKGKLPRLLDFRMLVMEEDKKGAKKAADIIGAITGDGEYKQVVTALTSLMSIAAPPAAIFTMVDSAMKIIKRVVGCNEDDQMLNYAARYSEDFDNLGIGNHESKCDNIELGYEIVGK